MCEFLKVSSIKIFAVTKIKKGFNNSIGCNLKKYKSSQRLAPFTSTPNIGTKASNIKEIANNGIINLFNNRVNGIGVFRFYGIWNRIILDILLMEEVLPYIIITIVVFLIVVLALTFLLLFAKAKLVPSGKVCNSVPSGDAMTI